MRLLVSSVVVALLVLLLVPCASRAEESPGTEAKPAHAGEWDADRFWFATILSPQEAWEKLGKELRKAPRGKQRALRRDRARAYVEAFRSLGRDPGLAELTYLNRFHLAGELYGEAAEALSQVLHAADATPEQKGQAATGLAQLLVNSTARSSLGPERIDAVASAVDTWLSAGGEEEGAEARAGVRRYLAMYLDTAGRAPEAIRQLMLMALEDPSKATAAGRSLIRSLQGATHDLESYEVVRAAAAACVPVLQHLAAKRLARLKAGDDPDERALKSAEYGVERLRTMGLPIEMLGRKAPPWTLLEAYGDVKALSELEGKVVVLDFWATWCPWCIKSFPAIRDLIRDYADEGLAVVGVTAPASSVYLHRYDLDDDLASTGERPKPVARLARGEPDPDAEVPLLAEEEFRKVERETLAKFVVNHEMRWPVVMIDPEDPGRKYALGGWPHAVVLDREGRVRYFKSGALLKDRPEAVQAFREVLEDLLAEKATVAVE